MGSGLLTSPPGPREPSGGACCPEYGALGEMLTGPRHAGSPSAHGQMRAGSGWAGEPPGTCACDAHPPGVQGVGGGAQRRWRSPGDGFSRARSDCRLNTASPGEALARSHRGEPGLGRGSSESAPSPGVPVPKSPSPAKPGGTPGPRGPAPVGPTKPPESPPTLLLQGSPRPHPWFPEFSPGWREWRLARR